MWMAIAAPVLALATVGSTELVSVSSDRAKLQDAVDVAALDAAKEIGAGAGEKVAERAEASVLAMLTNVSKRATLEADARYDRSAGQVTLTVRGVRPSFFNDLLPPGGFRISASATAEAMNAVPLCVLGLKSSGEGLKVEDYSFVEAAGCAVHSNSDLEVAGAARVLAADAQASGQRRGSGLLQPAIQVGAEVREDPFTKLSLSVPASCMSAAKQDIKVEGLSVRTLAPGVHRGKVEVKDAAVLTLAPGQHWFCDGELKVSDGGALKGDGVQLGFHSTAKFNFEKNALVDLLGLKSGTTAGFLIVADRNNTQTFEIKSAFARRLEGVIYLPSAKLLVDTSTVGLVSGVLGTVTAIVAEVGQSAKWTVAIVHELNTKGRPHLHINDDYEGSTVPVPAGLQAKNVRLAR